MCCHCITSWCSNLGNVTALAGLEYPRGGRLDMDRDLEGQPRGYDMMILFDLILYVPSTIFQLNRDRSSGVEPVLS